MARTTLREWFAKRRESKSRNDIIKSRDNLNLRDSHTNDNLKDPLTDSTTVLSSRSTRLAPRDHTQPVSAATPSSINPQTQCAFLTQLPVEIRLQIYEYVIPERTLSIVEWHENGNESHFRSFDEGLHWPEGTWKANFDIGVPEDLGLLNLPLTCWALHLETLPLLYTQSVFSIHPAHNLPRFLASLPTSHRALIRSVTLHTAYYDIIQPLLNWQANPWYAITTLPSLKHVTIFVKKSYGINAQDKEKCLAELGSTASKVRGSTWEVKVPWGRGSLAEGVQMEGLRVSSYDTAV